MGSSKRNASTAKRGTTTKNTAPRSSRKATNRPPTRKIVRWNDELDKKLLLATQSACNTLGIKLPWVEIAKLMGNDISDGAIVQHLAKMRTRMVDAGMEVPPPLRRGGTTALSKTSRSATANSTRNNKAKRKSRVASHEVASDSESEFDDIPANSQESQKSDDEYVAAGASFLKYPTEDESEGEAGIDKPSPLAQKFRTSTKVVKLRIPKANLQQTGGVPSAATEQPAVKTEDSPMDIMHYASTTSSSAGRMSDIREKPEMTGSSHQETGLYGLEDVEPNPVWIGSCQTDIMPSNCTQWGSQNTESFPPSTFPSDGYSFHSLSSLGAAQDGYHVNPSPLMIAPMSASSNVVSHGDPMRGGSFSWMPDGREAGLAAMNSFSSFGSSFGSGSIDCAVDNLDYDGLLMLNNGLNSFDGGLDSLL